MEHIQLLEILRYSSLCMVKCKETYSSFPTPFRDSGSPTLIIKSDNTWVDVGMKDSLNRVIYFGGDLIDFIIAVGISGTRTEAIEWIECFGRGEVSYVDISGGINWRDRVYVHERIMKRQTGMRGDYYNIIKIEKHIENVVLQNFLLSNNISLAIAEYFLNQAYVESGYPLVTKDEVLILKTEEGTFQMLTPYETKFIGEVSMSFFPGRQPWQCAVFVHIFDYLHLLSMGRVFIGDVFILNHYSLEDQCLSLARRYEKVSFFLRNNKHSDQLHHDASIVIPDAIFEFMTISYE